MSAAQAGLPVRSVYVHAPFCARRCPYCDFAVQVRRQGDRPGWTDALAGELRALAQEGRFPLASELDTLYVGGGTPSLLGADAMDALARVLGPERLRAPGLEWTAEANPESFTPEVAAEWRAAGVSRLSLGVQSFHEPTLAWMGRMHGGEGARRAVATARAAGLTDLSIDLIFALPDGHEGGPVPRSWDADLDQALALSPPHVSLYGLTVEAGTPLARSVAEGRVRVASEERYREEYLRAVERLRGAGYVHYEVSNFALPGHDSRHNRVYWEGGAYLGLGNGAHSFSDPLRRWNVRDWEDYARRAGAGMLAVAEEETVVGEARRLERTWLGLRTDRGLPWTELGAEALALVGGWMRSGWAWREAGADGDRLRLTAEGWLLLDRLAVELDGAWAARERDPARPTA
jgi:oxygen-independent coproporphyrinogen III oxidase